MSNYIIYNPQGGREGHSYQYTTNLCVGLLGIGKTVDLVTSPDFDSKCIEDSGAGVTFTNTNNSKSKVSKHNNIISKIEYGLFIVSTNIRAFFTLNKVLRGKKNGVCLMTDGDTLTNIIYLLLSYWRSSFVFALTIHNADYILHFYKNDRVKYIYKMICKILLKILARTPVIIFVHGEAMRSALSNQLNIEEGRISIYKVPSDNFSEIPNKNKQKDSINLLFCGVMREDKGFDHLCEALSDCKPFSNWNLRVAGTTRQVGDKYVYDLTRKFDIEGQCTHNHKYMTTEEIDSEFSNADIVVLPYKKNFIAQSVVFVDSMRWGKPVVASKHSQNGYDTTKYSVGWVFESENVNSLKKVLSEAIRSLKKNKNEFGFKGFMYDHSLESIAKSIVNATEK
jgi:glycosyltransferase involved in cell wall biosynthesis